MTTKARIKGHATKFIYADGHDYFSISIRIGNAVLDGDDLESLNNLVDFLKEHPSHVLDMRYAQIKSKVYLTEHSAIVDVVARSGTSFKTLYMSVTWENGYEDVVTV